MTIQIKTFLHKTSLLLIHHQTEIIMKMMIHYYLILKNQKPNQLSIHYKIVLTMKTKEAKLHKKTQQQHNQINPKNNKNRLHQGHQNKKNSNFNIFKDSDNNAKKLNISSNFTSDVMKISSTEEKSSIASKNNSIEGSEDLTKEKKTSTIVSSNLNDNKSKSSMNSKK